ncbi:hypothetical protein SFRURICE_019867 [Spodoptera frugiperda]|nr:hypothetical protein SFRURICE_019867 [Spodoptera frugiperda]
MHYHSLQYFFFLSFLLYRFFFIVTPFIPEVLARVHTVFTICDIRLMYPLVSHLLLEKNRKQPINTLPNSGIEPETPCLAVTFPTTRPTRQSAIKMAALDNGCCEKILSIKPTSNKLSYCTLKLHITQ